MTKCCFPICRNDIGKYGHNAMPLMEGRCCHSCNKYVVAIRIQNTLKQGDEEE